MNENITNHRQKRGLRYGSMSVAITIVFIAVVILINVVVMVLGERYALRIDLTKNKIFQLSTASVRFLERLDKEVKIYVLTSKDYFSGGNMYYVQAQDVIEQYAARSSFISLEYIDLPRNPGWETRFPQFQLSSYTIILECGENASILQINDLFNTDYDPYSYTEYITSSKAEQTLTSAIMGVTVDHQVSVAILEGFGEGGAEALESILVTNNYNVIHQNILTEEISLEAEFAIICAPMRDYTEETLQKLDRYLQNDGHYGRTLLYFASIMQPDTSNLNAFLGDWGVSVDDGIVYQTNRARLVALSNFWSAAEYTEYDYGRTAIERQLLTVVPEARPLSMLYDNQDSKAVSSPLTFTETVVVSPLSPNTGWTPDSAERIGPIPAFIITEETAYDSAQRAQVTSHVLVFGSSEFISSTLLSSRTVGNLDYILNIFAMLSSREESGYIAPKAVGTQELLITADNIVILGIIFIGVLPFGVLLAGGAMFFKRRRL